MWKGKEKYVKLRKIWKWKLTNPWDIRYAFQEIVFKIILIMQNNEN